MRFTKVDAKRYEVAIDRDRGPALLPRFGPAHDAEVPHDVAHWVVEVAHEIRLGVWGQLAAGGGGLFWPAPADRSHRYQQQVRRIAELGRPDMVRSEELAQRAVRAWRGATAPDDDRLGRAVAELDGAARRWQELPYGGSLTFAWPRALVFDTAGTQRGRRSTRDGGRLRR